MSTTNLDLPVLISAEQIRRREFVTIRRGYDPDQVRGYLEQLADQVELMRVLLRDAQAEAQTAARRTTAQPRHDPYQQLGERVASVIREADQVAETIKTEAHRDAELVTRDARAEADRVRTDAQAKADRVRTDAQAKAEDARSQAETALRAAREEADRTIAGLSTRRDALVDQLASMQERLIGVARDLESAMDVKVTIPDFPSIEDLREESPERDGSSAGEDDRTTAAASAFEGSAQDDPIAPDESAMSPIGAGAFEVEPEASAVGEPMIVVGEAEDTADDDGPSILDPSYEELWDGTDAMKLDIPALDLDWGDIDEGDEAGPYA
jgi:DivIVA domain-containing protein